MYRYKDTCICICEDIHLSGWDRVGGGWPAWARRADGAGGGQPARAGAGQRGGLGAVAARPQPSRGISLIP